MYSLICSMAFYYIYRLAYGVYAAEVAIRIAYKCCVAMRFCPFGSSVYAMLSRL